MTLAFMISLGLKLSIITTWSTNFYLTCSLRIVPSICLLRDIQLIWTRLTKASSSRILVTCPQTISPTLISKHWTGNLFSTQQAPCQFLRTTPTIDAKMLSLQTYNPCSNYYWLLLASFWPMLTLLLIIQFIIYIRLQCSSEQISEQGKFYLVD